MIGFVFFCGNRLYLPIIDIKKKENDYYFSFDVSPTLIRNYGLLKYKNKEDFPKLLLNQNVYGKKLHLFCIKYPKKDIEYLSYTPLRILISTTLLGEDTEYSQRKNIFQETINQQKEILKELKTDIYKLEQSKKEKSKQIMQEIKQIGERHTEMLKTSERIRPAEELGEGYEE